MTIALTIAYILLTAYLARTYIGAGWSKLNMPPEHLDTMNGHWLTKFTRNGLRTIGALELAGITGMVLAPIASLLPILPSITSWIGILAPIAAIGLSIIQAGATIGHIRHGETQRLWTFNIPLLAASILAAIIGFIVWI